jgi:hypothetical protein
MTQLAPPKPSPPDELEALIEEARRRARRRRLAYLAATVLAVAFGAGIYSIVSFTGGGGGKSSLPAGFSYVQARGSVQHVRVDVRSPFAGQVVQAASGKARPYTLTEEVWYDRAGQLYRARQSLAGRTQLDLVAHAFCQGPPQNRFCIPPGPLTDLQSAPRWPLDPKRARVIGQSTFRGRPAVWVKSLGIGGNADDRWALDPATHQPVVYRTVSRLRGRSFVNDEVFTVLPDLPAKDFRFAVPEGGAQQSHSFPPLPELVTQARATSVSAVGDVLGTPPLWLGQSFRGHRLRRLETGTEGFRAKTGRTLLPAKFVSFDYGALKLREFGAQRSFRFLQGPFGGEILVFGGNAEFTRGALLIVAAGQSAIAPAEAIALAKALRALPAG